MNAVDEALRVSTRGVLITVPYREELMTTVCVHCHQATPLWGHQHSFDERSFDYLGERVTLRSRRIPRVLGREAGFARWLYRKIRPQHAWIGFVLEHRA